MTRLVQGQRLKCGCVVGHYWCGPHDIYAIRRDTTYTWCESDGSFVWLTLQPNAHKPTSDILPVRSDLDFYEPEGCSCHICPPCSWCVEKPDPDEADAARSAREGE